MLLLEEAKIDVWLSTTSYISDWMSSATILSIEIRGEIYQVPLGSLRRWSLKAEVHASRRLVRLAKLRCD